MGDSLQDRIALVTGGSSGIGFAMAKRFIFEGAHVVITGRRAAELEAAVADLGPKATGIRADVASLSDLDLLYDQISTRFGRLDVLAANAGGGDMAALGEISEKHFDDIFSVNVRGLLFTVQKALPLLRPGSSIILTGSTTSIEGTPAFSVYSASKAAVRNFARTWILDLRGKGIRLNVLSPGATKTPGLLGLAPAEQQQAMLDTFAEKIPLGRVGDPDEIGKVAVFLASDASSFVTGIELFADGGAAQI